MSIHDEMDAFLRTKLKERLQKLTDKQMELYRKIFPEEVPSDKLIECIMLCDRTIKINELRTSNVIKTSCSSPTS